MEYRASLLFVDSVGFVIMLLLHQNQILVHQLYC